MVEKRWKKRKQAKKPDEPKINEEFHDNDSNPEEEDEEKLPKWYAQFKGDKLVDQKVSEEELTSLRIEAQTILDEETKNFKLKQLKVKKGSNLAWINTVLKKGTAKDKVAANVVTIQNSPLYSLSNLSALVVAVNPAKKKECSIVMETLAELFIDDLLRPERKLRTFDKQPLAALNEISGGCAKGRRLRLTHWLFEDKLKDLYSQFVQSVNIVAKDTVEANRIKAVSVMYKLLSSHPEQEQVLLQNLVNKLGDPQQKVVAKVSYCLTQMLRIHPNMKQIVMNEVEKILFRSNISSRTQYYCVCFLSQFIFQSKDVEIARNMITIYFSFFKALIKKGEIDSRLMGALLMGVKRAHPYAKLDSNSITEHIDTLYKLVHLTPFNVALHALALLQEISNDTNDRFYCALYKKLLDPKLNISCHHAMLINLIFKALSKDSNIARVRAFIKRLLQVCLYSSVPLICGLLYMISQLISRRKVSLFAESVEPQHDVFASFNLKESEEYADEKYVDADKEEETEEYIDFKAEEVEEKKPLRGWLHCEMNRQTSSMRTSLYDPLARNPTYANADKTVYLELLYLSRHFHPTVSLFSNKILKQEVITYTGDPLIDFTIAKFLERFVFKNPKVKTDEEKGPEPQLAQRKYYQPSGLKAMQVTSTNYLASDISNIPVDELFLYKYLKGRVREKSEQDDEEDDDNASVTSEEFVEMIEKMCGSKKKQKIDFMDEIGHSLKNKSKGKGKSKDEDTEEEEETDEDDNDDDEEEEELSDLSGDDEDEVMDFDDTGEDFEGDLDFKNSLNSFSNKSMKNDKAKLSSKKITKHNKNEDIQNLFAPAEEFAEILEEAGSSKHKPGMATSLATEDNAAYQQLDWETKRDRWVRDANVNKRKWKGKNQKQFKKRRN